MTPAVMLDNIDHCANKAIPMTVSTDPINTNSSDWSTPKIEEMTTTKIKKAIMSNAFFIILALVLADVF